MQVENYHSDLTSATHVPVIRYAETPFVDDQPARDLAGDVARLLGLYALGQHVPVVEQVGSMRSRQYQTRHDIEFGMRQALDHVRGRRVYAIGAPSRIRVVTIDLDNRGWKWSHERRLRLALAYCQEVLDVVPVVQQSPGDGHHVSWLWPSLVGRDDSHRALVADMTAYFDKHDEKFQHVEVRPTGQALRFPCGRRQYVVDPETLERVPGTFRHSPFRGYRRSVPELVGVFVDRLESAVVDPVRLDLLLRRHPADVARPTRPIPSIRVEDVSTPSKTRDESRIIKGRVWADKIDRLLTHGVEVVGTRNDAVGKLCFYFYVQKGHSRSTTLSSIREWLLAHDHVSNTTDFVGQSLTDSEHWINRLESAVERGELFRKNSNNSRELIATPDMIKLPSPNNTIHSPGIGSIFEAETVSLLEHLCRSTSPTISMGHRQLLSICATRTNNVPRRRFITMKRRHLAVCAREYLVEKGVLTRLHGHDADRGRVTVWTVDVALARLEWTDRGFEAFWPEDEIIQNEEQSEDIDDPRPVIRSCRRRTESRSWVRESSGPGVVRSKVSRVRRCARPPPDTS